MEDGKLKLNNGVIMQANESLAKPVKFARQGMDLTTQLAEDIAEEITEDHEFKDLLEEVKQQMLLYVQFEATAKNFKGVVTELRDSAASDGLDEDVDIDAILMPKFEALEKQAAAPAELKKTDAWKEFNGKVMEILDPEGLGGRDGGDAAAADSDDEMLVTQEETNINCPITRKPFANPMKNKKCNHTYDQEGVEMIFAQRGSHGFKCPFPSCTNRAVIERSDLEVDRRMIRIMKARKTK